MQWLFVCTGNTCRSAMAEAIARQRLAERLGCSIDALEARGYKCLSAGTMNLPGAPASPGAVAACAERGLDLTAHRSRGLTDDLVVTSDRIFVMDDGHREAVVARWPEVAPRCLLLDPDGPIPDPVGQPLEVFRACAERIDRSIKKRVREFLP